MTAVESQANDTGLNVRFSMPRLLLHTEGLAVFAAAIFLYARYTDAPWWLFLVLLLTPDVAMLPYFISPRWGAVSYNVLHTYLAPIALIVTALLIGWNLGLALGLILLAHIGMDRTVGYGLKYGIAFKETHLGRV